jgi:protein TonB
MMHTAFASISLLALSAVPAAAASYDSNPHSCYQYYPPGLEAAGVTGTTQLAFTITSTGKVRDVRVSQSSGNGGLDDAAILCAKSWRYNPAQRGGEAVESPWVANVVWAVQKPPGA